MSLPGQKPQKDIENKMDKSSIVKTIGFPGTLIHGDTLVVDRWLWLRKRLPRTANGEKLIDIGCGSGAFTIGSALRGYHVLGLSWDERNQRVAQERAGLCKTSRAAFEVMDVRHLDTRSDLVERFDVAVCSENIEHILDDRKLLGSIAACLKPGGYILLSTPYYHFRAMTRTDNGPFSRVEDGRHVRRGYTPAMLAELCEHAGLVCEEQSFCSGFLSQKITALQRVLGKIHPLFAWGVTLPLRILPPVFDGVVTRLIRWPFHSICIVAYKPRFSQHPAARKNGRPEASPVAAVSSHA